MAEDQSVAPESLPADVQTAPSADGQAEAPVSQQAPASPSQPDLQPEEQKVPLTRFQEVIRERDMERQRSQQLMELAQRSIPQPQMSPEADPYAGMDATTAQFYRDMDVRIKREAAQIVSQRMQPLEQAYHLGRQQLVQVTLKEFYKENPDITPNSQEAMAIAGYIQQYPTLSLEEAKNIVMAPKYAQQAKNGQQRTQTKTEQAASKQRLAPEAGSGIPASSGIAPVKRSFRETLQSEMESGG